MRRHQHKLACESGLRHLSEKLDAIQRLKDLEIEESPFSAPIPRKLNREVHWQPLRQPAGPMMG
jgi:hypothetical protein